jgi:dipeptidase
LIADGHEAFAVETAGRHWVYQEIRELRAASNVCIIHQDWDRISHGLADLAIGQGWWAADGSKLDFADTLMENPMGQSSGLRRWGRATLLLEQQNGHIDMAFVRRLLGDHYEGTHFEVDPLRLSVGPVPICQHGNGPGGATTASMIIQLTADTCHLPIVWRAFGPPCESVYFPLFFEGDLPYPFTAAGHNAGLGRRLDWLVEALRHDPHAWERLQESFCRLQAQFDHDAAEAAIEGALLKQRGQTGQLYQLMTGIMSRHLEQFEAVLDEFLMPLSPKPESLAHRVLAR